jgi:hypothetical protein
VLKFSGTKWTFAQDGVRFVQTAAEWGDEIKKPQIFCGRHKWVTPSWAHILAQVLLFSPVVSIGANTSLRIGVHHFRREPQVVDGMLW